MGLARAYKAARKKFSNLLGLGVGFGGEAVGGDRKVRLLRAGDLQSSLTYKWGTAIMNERATIIVAGIH